jgi:hypothetical protein
MMANMNHITEIQITLGDVTTLEKLHLAQNFIKVIPNRYKAFPLFARLKYTESLTFSSLSSLQLFSARQPRDPEDRLEPGRACIAIPLVNPLVQPAAGSRLESLASPPSYHQH